MAFFLHQNQKKKRIPESLNWGCSVKFNGAYSTMENISRNILIWLCQQYGMLSMTTENNLDNVKYL